MVIRLQKHIGANEMQRRSCRRGDGGFTLTELMIVLVILATISMVAAPRFTRDSSASDGRSFADLVTREIQRARLEAITTRLPQYVFLYADRVEIRAAKPGATPTAPLVAPTTSDPIQRIIRAKPGISVLDLSTSSTVTTSLGTGKQLVFSTLGIGFIGPTAPPVPTAVYVHLRNTTVQSSHPEYGFRVDIAPLTGFVKQLGQ
jgi:prepilin-type N-terminal cleavage/methylation domain-containing protein